MFILDLLRAAMVTGLLKIVHQTSSYESVQMRENFLYILAIDTDFIVYFSL